MGGTFNPVHMGHLLLAETVRSDYPLDKILFMPAAIPPHKEQETLCSAELRLRMLELAVEPYPFLGVSDYEIQKGGVSYTIDTVRWLQSDSPYQADELFLIIGGDSLVELHTWRCPEDILNQIQTLVIARSGFDFEHVSSRYLEAVQMIETPLIDISSSQIRERVRSNRSIRFWVPDSVAGFILENGLYRS